MAGATDAPALRLVRAVRSAQGGAAVALFAALLRLAPTANTRCFPLGVVDVSIPPKDK
jgi:hypothetical protein